MSRTNLSISCLIAFIIGIAIHEQVPYMPSFFTYSTLSLLGIIIILSILKTLNIHFSKLLTCPPKLELWTVGWERRRKLLTLLTFLLAGILRGQSTLHIPSPETIDYYLSETSQTIIGTIVEEPDVRRDKVNYTIEVQERKVPITNLEAQNPKDIKNSKFKIKNFPWLPTTGRILISTGKYPSYHYGDSLEISGQLQAPASFDSFDYAAYLSRYGIYSVMYRPQIKISNNELRNTKQIRNFNTTISSETIFFENLKYWVLDLVSHFHIRISHFKSSLFSILLEIKASFEHQMNQTFSTEPSASFMAGLLLGSRKGLPEQLNEDFRITGLTHIIAISGYNITLIVSILMAFFRPLGKKSSIILSALGIIIFTLFVGASPAVVRACIMGLISLLALSSNRKGAITLTLLVTASLMIGYNPKILFHDAGFQLSFLATMGLIYVAPLIEPFFKWLPKTLAIRESIVLTLSAQIMALPIILYTFQQLSLVSPLSNLLIAGPILPLAMLFGFIGTISSFFSLAFAKLIAFPAYLLLQYVTSITRLTAKIPYANIEISWFNQVFFISYFLCLGFILKNYWSKQTIIHLSVVRKQQLFQHQIAQILFISSYTSKIKQLGVETDRHLRLA